ncbi:replicative DNA helicase [Caulobacter sp. BE264]|uniref:replicative DNA helicase n=1 Tax=Caulobacter sp. BE264 TaxID=2817724 RepID=UPI002865B0CF|nr:DnaB-like helicase C-terminal domain-containing protein [Caulobacter sp. BE264]MDR7232810.1 replicative DNA helicase [Caulobacter sp. BE264]
MTDTRPAQQLAALFDIDAEMRLLGICLEHNEIVQSLAGLEARHFHEPFHQRAWAFITKKVQAGVAVDPLTVHDAFKDGDPAYQELGALRYLAMLVEHVVGKAAAHEYARIIVERSTRRDLVETAALIAEKARDPAEDLREVVTKSEALLADIARGSEPNDANLVDANTSAAWTIEEMRKEALEGRPKGLMTGLRCVDRRLRGLRPGCLIVIAGRPSMGKSGLARQIAHGAARRNPEHQFPFYCLEMHRREMDERTLSELTFRDGQPIRYHDMNPEKFTPMDWDILERAARRVPSNMILDDTASLSVDYVRRRSWALRRKGPIGAIFIDYLQIMKRPAANGRNDAAVIGEMTTALKVLARELNCAVVLLSQINRGVESRDDKRPQLSDLKESGSIEQDANVVLFPFREVYYLERAEPRQGTPEHQKWEEQVELLRRRMDVLCAKNRGGAVGSDQQDYHAEYDAVTDVREEA